MVSTMFLIKSHYFCLCIRLFFCCENDKENANDRSVISFKLFVKMASSIKLFQFVQQCHQIIGVFPSQSNQNQRLIKSTKTKFLIFSAQLMVSTAGFLVFEAKSMFEYGFTFFILISIINSIVVYLIFIWQSKNTSKFVENCEGFIEKRK